MTSNIVDAQTVLHCPDLPAALAFFRDQLAFRITTIYPADNPAVVELTGHGLSLRLERNDAPDTGRLRIRCIDPDRLANGDRQLVAPNGTVVELVPQQDALHLPDNQQAFVITKSDDNDQWVSGRAGMQYRDLIPDRQGGRFIASHIRIPDGGPVPDYVHYHQIRFQLIYCYKGWVKVVYEDQGEPFVMRAGDCVLQPPLIRHRVLESSSGLEVIEIGCPAEHYTRVDHALTLPTDRVNTDRDFSGQRFTRHQAALTTWQSMNRLGFEHRETDIGAATHGLAEVREIRLEKDVTDTTIRHDGEFLFWFVLEGSMTLHHHSNVETQMRAGDAVTIPAAMVCGITSSDTALRVLEVLMPTPLS